MEIRPVQDQDADEIVAIFKEVVAGGDTYVFSPATPAARARSYWFGEDIKCYVAVEGGKILGMYKLVPNQPDLGSHVANASFMVSPHAGGRGIGYSMGQHCLREAKKEGFEAMQFNFVVSTNERAVALWKNLGFSIVGTLPKAFRHRDRGLVDAYVMYRFLDDIRV